MKQTKTETQQILVSVCIVTKDKEGQLKRCLDSVLPITNEPWAELIVVDTGSSDRSVAVAKQHTDKVYEKKFVPWDFSKARNFSTSKAIGKKILIIDTDEQLDQNSIYILEDAICNPNQKMPTVFVTIRNFYNKNLTEYTEMLQPRLFTNDGKPIYTSDVHNKPRTLTPYFFSEQIVIKHYGYNFDGNKLLKDEKNDRSIPMLIADYKKDPKDIHILTHLIKGYACINEHDKVIKYGEKWMKFMRTVEYHEGWQAYLEVFLLLVNEYLMRKDFDNAERIRIEAEKYSNRLVPIYFMLASHYAIDKEDDETAAEYFKHGIAITKSEGSPYEILLTNNIKMQLPEAYHWLAIYHFKKGEYEKAGKYICEGIAMGGTALGKRWDIFNEAECAERLIKVK